MAVGADPHAGGDAISTAVWGAAGRIRSCLSFRTGSWAFNVVGHVVIVAVSRPTWATSVPPTRAVTLLTGPHLTCLPVTLPVHAADKQGAVTQAVPEGFERWFHAAVVLVALNGSVSCRWGRRVGLFAVHDVRSRAEVAEDFPAAACEVLRRRLLFPVGTQLVFAPARYNDGCG